MAHSSAILGNMPAKDIIHNSTHANPMYRGRGIIIKSMLAMIFKNVKDMFDQGLHPTSVFFVWDKRISGKYHKSTIIDSLDSEKGYKGDRGYVTDQTISDKSLEIDNCTDPEEKIKLTNEKLELEKSLIISNERFQAKNFIIENFTKFGIPSFSYEGYEADDLDLIFALENEKTNGCFIHYSGDSDWSFNLRPNDIFWQVNRSKLYKKNVADVKAKFKIREDMDLMEWAELFYSAKGSHNFLQRTFNPSLKRITTAILNKLYDKDFSDITDMERFEVQRKCFRIHEFPNYENVKEMYKEVIKFDVPGTVDEFKDMLDDLSLGDDVKFFMNRNYQDFLGKIRKAKLDNIQF